MPPTCYCDGVLPLRSLPYSTWDMAMIWIQPSGSDVQLIVSTMLRVEPAINLVRPFVLDEERVAIVPDYDMTFEWGTIALRDGQRIDPAFDVVGLPDELTNLFREGDRCRRRIWAAF